MLLFLGDCIYHLSLSSGKRKDLEGSLFAKFTPGAIVSEVRNKIAATVFTKNKAGASIRNRITPINRRSSTQTAIRQYLAGFSSGWRGLTDAQRASWNSGAANFPQTDNLGQTIFLTGAQLYQRCQQNLKLVGGSATTTCPSPTSFAVLALSSLTSDASAGTVSLAFSPTIPTGFQMVVRATRPVSAGKSFFSNSAYRFLKAIAAASTSPQALGPEYVAIFGAITSSAGLRIGVEAFLVESATGLAGIPVRINSVIVP
jgi:hypothetical protein